ncbi:MAG TPA: carbon-nitrogen hydrolase family protein [Clostridiales bacterium]|nr:carbon-nitrogen hydrolase family protein [Clostridiales bacterium]
MKFAALQLDNSIRGVEKRFLMIEQLIKQANGVQFVVLPELSTPGYIPTYEIWNYKESNGELTKTWAISMAKKYDVYIGCGYVDYSEGEYYNAYLIANKNGICGTVYKEEPESNIFKRGKFPHIIQTPLGKIAVGICFDSHRECFYDGIKNEDPGLILLPHAWAMSVDDAGAVKQENIAKTDFLGKTYAQAFGVPVVFCNAIGAVDRMAGITGTLMKNYRLVGQSSVYFPNGMITNFGQHQICLFDIDISNAGKLNEEIPFYGTYIDKGSKLFRNIVLPLDIRKGIKDYKRYKGQL